MKATAQTIYPVLAQAAVAGQQVEWRELMNAVQAAGLKVTNWMTVRGVLQFMIDQGLFTRVNSVHVEAYVRTAKAA